MTDNNKKTIILAEDDAPVRLYLSRILSINGFNVLEAVDGKAAIRIYEDKEIYVDGVVSDLRMPNVNGSELARYNYENKFLPFVVCTAVMDAELALELLRFGVQDYTVKPVEEVNFIGVVKNALNRRSFDGHKEALSMQLDGNIGSMIIPSRLSDLKRVTRAIGDKVRGIIKDEDSAKFMNFLGEFLLNAHEHGNLKIGEEEKSELLMEDKFEDEMASREINCDAKIEVLLSILEGEIAIKITDEGDGFNYDKYLSMDEDTLLKRITMPNGRGIFMASKYFDHVRYSKGGACLLLTKKLN